MFQVDHEDAFDSDVDEGPHAAVAFMANLSSADDMSDTNTKVINEVQTHDPYMDNNQDQDQVQQVTRQTQAMAVYDNTVRIS